MNNRLWQIVNQNFFCSSYFCFLLILGYLFSMNTSWFFDLSTRSPTFRRPNGRVGQYYYETIRFSVIISGYYNIKSISNIDTYGLLYSSTFIPTSPSSNLLLQDDDSGGSVQYQLTLYLQTNTIYTLVSTTYNSNTTGNYGVLISGISNLNIISTSMINQSNINSNNNECKLSIEFQPLNNVDKNSKSFNYFNFRFY